MSLVVSTSAPLPHGKRPIHALVNHLPSPITYPQYPPASRVAVWAFYMTPKEVLALIREKEVWAVVLRFMNFPGLWQHFTIPADTLAEATFEEGLGFEGSSIRG